MIDKQATKHQMNMVTCDYDKKEQITPTGLKIKKNFPELKQKGEV